MDAVLVEAAVVGDEGPVGDVDAPAVAGCRERVADGLGLAGAFVDDFHVDPEDAAACPGGLAGGLQPGGDVVVVGAEVVGAEGDDDGVAELSAGGVAFDQVEAFGDASADAGVDGDGGESGFGELPGECVGVGCQ